ncbi:type II toxin-antitoxin system HicA family toxin [Roseospira visakhapatnamensis]|uniref:HicA-like toxin of HicAB toxin-antitoxin system n=1 Tax=Roseospira visakhapatnamensis TaxID=390880 RepID=A0A7W6RHV4_9PROT|nr:type II toxin-antitoxin system HicA family toxin [Roseospira visakhapatnamensis]MBB4268276.1 hypothetical protein [Roseospira visakhapatnamensis]
MNSTHRKTLRAVFRDPVSGTIAWNDLESLLLAASADLVEGSGSRARFVAGTVVATVHRPHPARDTRRSQVRDARAFLESIGVTP